MTTILGQVVASTSLDAHGEQRDRASLEELAEKLSSRRLPLNQHHDMAAPTVGHIENFRVEPSAEISGEWVLLADVTFEGTPPTEGGFSFSLTEVTIRRDDAPFALFLPYPHYREHALLEKLAELHSDASVGRWIKKEVNVAAIALIVSMANLVLGPMWKRIYDDHVHPHLAEMVASIRGLLMARGVQNPQVHFIQGVGCEHYSSKVMLYFVPSEHADQIAFDFAFREAIEAALQLIEEDWLLQRKPVMRIVHSYSPEECRYVPIQVIYVDGSSRAPEGPAAILPAGR